MLLPMAKTPGDWSCKIQEMAFNSMSKSIPTKATFCMPQWLQNKSNNGMSICDKHNPKYVKQFETYIKAKRWHDWHSIITEETHHTQKISQ